MTARRVCACIRNCMIPAPSRRATMPTARSSATPMNRAKTATSMSVPISPVSNAGQHHVVGRPAEHPGVGDGQRAEDDAAEGGEREDPRLPADRRPRVRRARHPSCPAASARPSSTPLSPAGTRGLARVFPPSDIGTGAVAIAVCSRHDRQASRAPPSASAASCATSPSPSGRRPHPLRGLGRPRPALAPGRPRAQPIASMGNVVDAMSGLTERAMAQQRQQSFEVLVEQYRKPALFLRAMPVVDEAMNGFELLVHHEDLRRGAQDWEPRELAADELDSSGRSSARACGSSAAATGPGRASGARTPARPRPRRRATTRSRHR